MTREEALALLRDAPFREAKTRRTFNPHMYTLRDEWDSAVFSRVVEVLRRDSYTYYFYGKPYLQLDGDGYTYWEMGDPTPDDVKLINRKPTQQVKSEAETSKGRFA